MTSPAARGREAVLAYSAATAAAETLTVDGQVDGQEVLQARWFTRAELLEPAASGGRLGRPDSIDRYLLRSWLDESG